MQRAPHPCGGRRDGSTGGSLQARAALSRRWRTPGVSRTRSPATRELGRRAEGPRRRRGRRRGAAAPSPAASSPAGVPEPELRRCRLADLPGGPSSSFWLRPPAEERRGYGRPENTPKAVFQGDFTFFSF